MTVTDDTTPTTGPPAGEPDPTGVDTPQAPEGQPAEDDQDDDPEVDDDQGTPGRERRLRHRAQAAEVERDALAATLAATRAGIVRAAVSAAGFDADQFGRLLVAAERTADTLLGDDAMIDADKLGEAIATTAREYGVNRRGLESNLQQGTNRGGHPGKSSWAGALKG